MKHRNVALNARSVEEEICSRRGSDHLHLSRSLYVTRYLFPVIPYLLFVISDPFFLIELKRLSK